MRGIDHLGHMPVSFFFVLSGFLITYLLLKEMETCGRISVRAFYWRRVIRLWPVYFLVVLLALAIIPVVSRGFDLVHFDFGWAVPIALVLFLPNILRIIHPNMVGANQLWSVGVEEQFYLFWPILIGMFSRNVMSFLLGFIALKFLVQEGGIGLLMIEVPRLEAMYFLLKLFPVEQMAIGGLGAAVLIRRQEKMVGVLRSDGAFAFSLLMVVLLILTDPHWFFRSHVEGLAFLTVILNIISRPEIYRWLEINWLRRLGNISYGMYMYHTLVISAMLSVLVHLKLDWVTFNVLLYAGSVLFTIALSKLSFKYLETPFLKLRNWKLSMISDWKVNRI